MKNEKIWLQKGPVACHAPEKRNDGKPNLSDIYAIQKSK